MANAALAPRTTIPDGYLTFHVGTTIIASPSFREMDEAVTEYAANRNLTQPAGATPANSGDKKTHHKLSAAGRKRIAEAAKERWAEQKAGAKGKKKGKAMEAGA